MRTLKHIIFIVIACLFIAVCASAINPRFMHEKQPGPYKSITVTDTINDSRCR